MTIKEVKEHVQNGAIISVEFPFRINRKCTYCIENIGRITEKQFNEIKPLLVNFKNDFNGLTTHFYKLKK